MSSPIYHSYTERLVESSLCVKARMEEPECTNKHGCSVKCFLCVCGCVWW